MIRIVTDGASGISADQMKSLDIDVLPLSIRFGDDIYLSNEITDEDFYRRMAESEEKPSTMQVNPSQYEDVFRKHILAGDEILGIMLGSKLSGTYQSAVIASNEFSGDKITFVDTKTLATGQVLLVEEAVRLRNEGKGREEIAEHIKSLVPRTKMIFILDNLDFVRHGGRVSPDEYVAGENLGIHPVMEVHEKFNVIGKVKGVKGTNRFIMEQINEFGLLEDSKIYLCHGNAPELAGNVKKMLRKNGLTNEIHTYCLNSIVGAHMGANSVGISFVGK